jgi:hypothetical protein
MRNLVNMLALALVVFLAGSIALPAVRNVREAAAQTQCQSNLRQIALSVANYESSRGYFPQATMENPRLTPDQRLSWLSTILPFLESTNFFAEFGINRDKGWNSEENHIAALTTFRLYQCPAFPIQRPSSTFAPTHYVGIAGLGPDAAMLPLDDPRAGAFGHDRKWSFSDLNRSTNTLIIVADTTRVGESWTSGGWPTVRGLEQDGPPQIGTDGQFGGVHRVGALAACVDGSVRVLRPTLDNKVFEAMATLHSDKRLDEFPDR